MKLRNGRRTSLTYEIEIPNKKSKKNGNEHAGRNVKLVKKNNVLNKESSSCKNQSKSKTSNSKRNSFSGDMKSLQFKLSVTSISNQRVNSHSNKVMDQPSTSSYLPVPTPIQSIIFDSSELRDRPSTSLEIPTTSTSNHSVISGSCEIRQPCSTSSHSPTTSTPNDLSKTMQNVSTKNLNSSNKCTGNYMNIINSTKNNYYSPISDTSLTALNINSATMSKNVTIEDNTPLTIDVRNTNKNSPNRKKCSILGNIINQEQDSNDEDKTRKSIKRKRNVSVRTILSSVEMFSEQTEKDDECSIISVQNNDEDIVVLEREATPNLKNNNQKSDTTPSKRQKTSVEVPIIDLCTPDQPSKQSRIRSKGNHSVLPFLYTMKNMAKFKHSKNIKYSLKESDRKNLHPNNLISQNRVPSIQGESFNKSRKALREYMSIMGTVTQRGPFPQASSTVTSSSKETEPRHDVPSTSKFGSNIYNPNPDPIQQTGLRPIVIDGSNVAFGHTNGAYFSCRGLKFCIDFFLKRNHKVLAFVPKFRRHDYATKDPQLLDELQKQGVVSFTPSRKIHGKLVVPYDDRYIVQYAAECGGIIVSTDNYHDLIRENPTWKETIEKRLLMFTWAGDILIFPQDPLGRYGPNLENFLRFP